MTEDASSTGAKQGFTCVVPILNVRDVTASIDHYVTVLGFKKDWDWGDPPGFGSVSRGEVSIFFCGGAQGGQGTWMSLWVKDVDALHREYQASGANIRQPPTNFPWGVREMNVQDPDGHRLRIGTESHAPADGVPLCED